MTKAQILAIVGPTAVGKTDFASQVAQDILTQNSDYTGVDFFSADSRQVYQGLEIISGADLPNDVSFAAEPNQRFWQSPDEKYRWYGVSMIKPNQEWSVAHFQRLVQEVLPQSFKARRLPIIVGGTGLYVNQALETDSQLHVPPNPEIRDKAEILTLPELQAWVREVDLEKWQSMNDSDQFNPRRLVRALEIALFTPDISFSREKSPDVESFSRENMVIIGLQDDFEHIELRIKKRVEERWQQGALEEVQELIANYPDQKLPVFSTTGTKAIMSYLNDQISESEAKALWVTQERQYAKRQMTWWKKRSEVMWFNVGDADWQKTALIAVEKKVL